MSSSRRSLFTTTSSADVVNWTSGQKCELIDAFWPHLRMAEKDFIAEDYAGFFDFIGRATQALYPHATKFASQDLDGLFTMVYTLRLNPNSTRQTISENVKVNFLNVPDDAIARFIELTIRLWIGINVCSKNLSVGPRNPRNSRIEWHDHQALDEIISSQFKDEPSGRAVTDFSLDQSFTALNLRNICRVHIRWTDNIKDHLRLEGPRGHRSLSVYRHKILLINHRKATDQMIIPAGILDEAIRTIDLLFPFGDLKTEEFLKEENVQFYFADPLEQPRATSLDDFKYWRNNIVQLLALLNGPPETVVQTLLDTRNIGQFATIWFAIFGVFAITILFGILASVYSVKQYWLAVKSYELSLAMACLEKGSALAQFCS